MGVPHRIYRESLALLTDLYQITMGQGYWRTGLAEREAAFHLFFRSNPFGGGYTLAAGLEYALDFVRHFRFTEEDIAYLRGLRDGSGEPLFDAAYLDALAALRLTVDIEAVPEGTVVFPQEPLVRVTGPILQAQLLETPLLNLLNFQTLIATKAARICDAAGDAPVIEFGLRRAQGIDGGLTATRAAFIGGCAATSNVLAGKVFGIAVKGTHAHSWVMAFGSEREAFEAWAEAMPNNCVLLVDTYDSLDGIRAAVEVGRRLEQRGHRMVGIRLDSGDLAYLSTEARRLLDEAGLSHALILASNDLDEHVIESLRHQGAAVGAWGVGTKLVTADGQSALGGVYKLAAIRDERGVWRDRVKVSEQAVKSTTPGLLRVRRYRLGDEFIADAIYDERHPPEGEVTIIDPLHEARRKRLPAGTPHEELLVPAVRHGEVVHESPSLPEIQARARAQLKALHPGIRRLLNPHTYPAGLERRLFEHRLAMIREVAAQRA